MAAIPVGARPVPEKDGAKHHRRIDHTVILGAIGVVAHPVNGIDHQNDGDEDKDQHHNPC